LGLTSEIFVLFTIYNLTFSNNLVETYTSNKDSSLYFIAIDSAACSPSSDKQEGNRYFNITDNIYRQFPNADGTARLNHNVLFRTRSDYRRTVYAFVKNC